MRPMSPFMLLGVGMAAVAAVTQQQLQYGNSSYTCVADFDRSIFAGYYSTPAGQQLQPIINDTVAGKVYPLNLTSPTTIPTVNNVDPYFFPPANGSGYTREQAYRDVLDLVSRSGGDNCTKCIDGLKIAQRLARTNGSQVPQLAVDLCQHYGFKSNSSCASTYRGSNLGAPIAQVLAFANLTNGLDGQYICNLQLGYCAEPATQKLDVAKYIPKKPKHPPKIPKASGKRFKVPWFSDFHIDPRYANGAEANCSSGLCCRAPNTSAISVPAPRFGAYACDVSLDLGAAALSAIPKLSSVNGTPDWAFSLFSGDLVSHDQNPALSRDYVTQSEALSYRMFRTYLGSRPVYAVESNHDTYPIALDLARSAPGNLSEAQFGWNYAELSGLWYAEGWLEKQISIEARSHYSAYSVLTAEGLRVVALNGNAWYPTNLFNLYNMTDLDRLDQFSFLAKELLSAESKGERVLIIAHEYVGWDGKAAFKDQSNLLYALVERFSVTISALLFGHAHEDFFSVYYAQNGTDRARPINTMWSVPSITPLTNLNAGFRILEFDSGSLEIMDARTYYSDVSTYASLNSTGPTFKFEYSLREAYDPNSTWPADAPLNGSFFDHAVRAMERQPSLIDVFTKYQGKSSKLTPNCTSQACRGAKLCYMRSASAALARNCTAGYGSVQGKGS